MIPGEKDNALGLILRVTVPTALVYAAYTVAFCPCDKMLECHAHGQQYFFLMLFAMLGVFLHMQFGAQENLNKTVFF
jgi:hypothetical protein